MRPVDQLVRVQKANGSFPLLEVLNTLDDNDYKEIKDKLLVSKPENVDDFVWGTAIALVVSSPPSLLFKVEQKMKKSSYMPFYNLCN